MAIKLTDPPTLADVLQNLTENALASSNLPPSELGVQLRMCVQAFRMDPRTKQMLIDAADTLDQQTNELATLKATLERVEAERNELRELIISFGDEEPCEYDHHDYCQAHLLHERPCPYGKANELRAALREGE